MSEANHTPGPWYSLSGKAGTVELSNCVGPHWSSPDHYVGSVLAHNAPLIKAAPEMLHLLCQVIEFLDGGCGVRPGSLLEDDIRRVYLKAGGI